MKAKRTNGLRCPECSGGCNDTVDSRPTHLLDHLVIRRRKRCRHCNARWTTYEINDDDITDILELTAEDVVLPGPVISALTTGDRQDG